MGAIATLKAKLTRLGIKHPAVMGCGHCDFGSGMRGMDSCSKCNGYGSIFRVKGQVFPNSEQGYEQACRAALTQEPSHDR